METIAEDGDGGVTVEEVSERACKRESETETKKKVVRTWCQRENEAEPLRIRQQRKRDIYIDRGRKRREERTKVLWLIFRAGGGARLSLPYIRTINEAFSRP